MASVRFLYGPQPKVTLLHATPERFVALATRGYTGQYSVDISVEDQDRFWQELGDTKLKAPLEMANTIWLIEDVTRAFTHQIVRYRTAKFVQESLRFSVQDENRAVVMVPQTVVEAGGLELEEYCQSAENAFEEYHRLIQQGLPIQDARSVLPHSTCTRLYMATDVRTLAHIAEQRFCCQAQGSGQGESGEWTSVVKQMQSQLRRLGYGNYASQLKAPWEEPGCVSCGFGASFDRPCSYQDRFNDNLKNLATKRLQQILEELQDEKA